MGQLRHLSETKAKMRVALVGMATMATVAGLLVALPSVAASASGAGQVGLTQVATVDASSTTAINKAGDKVAYTNTATPGRQVYLYDAGTAATTLVTHTSAGPTAPATGDAGSVAISGNGSYVAFTSEATDLDAAGAALSGLPQAYVAHVTSSGVSITRLPLPAAAVSGASSVAISADGSRVAFAGNAGASGTGQVYVDDWQEPGATPRAVDVTPSSASTRVVIDQVTLSADGSTIAAVVEDGTTAQPDGARLVLADPKALAESTMAGVEVERSSPAALTGDGSLVLAAPAHLDPDGTPTYSRADYLVSWQWRQGATPKDIGSTGSTFLGRPGISTDGHLVSYSLKYSDEDGYLVQVGAYPGVDYPNVMVSGDTSGYQSPTTGYPTNPALAASLPVMSGDGLHVAFRSNSSGLPDPPQAGQTTLYLATLNDSQAPSFSAGDQLSASNVQSDSLDLSWDDASDDLFVVGYTLSEDGTKVADLPANVSQPYHVGGLEPGTLHTFSLVAQDQSGHTSSAIRAGAYTATTPVTGDFDTKAVSDTGLDVDGPPSLSGDGRYVAYLACPFTYNSYGIPQCSSEHQVYATDTVTGTTTLVTHQAGKPGVPSSPPSEAPLGPPVISGNGHYVAFVSWATDLTPGVTTPQPRLYVYDRTSGNSTVVALPRPMATNGPPAQLAISADGSRLLVGILDATNYEQHVYVVDWQVPDVQAVAGGTALALSGDGSTAVVGSSGEVPAITIYSIDQGKALASFPHVYAFGVALSQDGSKGLLVAGQPYGGSTSTYLWDASHPSSPTMFGTGSLAAAGLSADATHVAYVDAGARRGSGHVYLGTYPTGSTVPAPAQVSAGGSPTLSADGSEIAYVASATDVPAGDQPAGEIFVAHAHDGTPPAFPGGATLVASSVTTTGLHLSWPAATDNVGVASYALTEDAKPLATLPAGTTSYDVTGLSPGTAYSFSVVAEDAVGNASAPLTVGAATLGSGGIVAGKDPLIAAAQPGGAVKLSWDADPAGPAGYRVLRDDGSGFQKVDAVAGGVTTFTDTGRPAETQLSYRVDAVDSAGNPGPWTAVAKVTTPAIAITQAQAGVPILAGPNHLAVLGGTVRLRVAGDPGRAASARITYQPVGTGGSTTKVVQLAEVPQQPGVYRGTWTIPEGAASFTSVTGVLSDGNPAHDATAAARDFPIGVSGALKVTVDKPAAGSVSGADLSVVSDSTDSGAEKTVDGGQTVTLPVAPAGDYSLRLTQPDSNYAVAHQAKISVSAGTTSSAELEPVLPAFLSVDVEPADYSSRVDVHGAGGQLLGSETGRDAYRPHAFGPFPAGSTVTVDTRLVYTPARYVLDVKKSVTLAPGQNPIAITHPALPTATITGHLEINDVGVYGHITATETVDGRPWTFTTTTSGGGSNVGSYSLPVLAGGVTVSGTTSYDSAGKPANATGTKTVTVGPGATSNVDLDLAGPHNYHLYPTLVIKEAGGTPVTEGVDWRTALDFGVSIKGPRGFWANPWSMSDGMLVPGQPGDVYTLCAHPVFIGLPKSCNSVTLGKSDKVSLPVTVMGAGRITAHLVDASGKAYSGHWEAQIYQLGAGGLGFAGAPLGTGSSFSANVPKAGTYRVAINTGSGSGADFRVSVPAGAVLDLGQIVLGPSTSNNGLLGTANSVVAEQSEVAPGQTVGFRVHYLYDSGFGASQPTATVRLGVPAGTTLVPGSVTLDGMPVANPIVSGGFAEVPIAGGLEDGDSGTLHYQVQTSSSTPVGTLPAMAEIAYSSGAPAVIGIATTSVIGVTLAVPSQVKEFTATATGHAPPGSTVKVYDASGQVVGQAMTGPGGLYMTTLLLPPLGDEHTYGLHAETIVGGHRFDSAVQSLTHDSHLVLPTQVTVSRSDYGSGSSVSFDPSTGVARFPFLSVPGEGLSLSACFPDGSSVSDLSFRLGPSGPASVRGAGVPLPNGVAPSVAKARASVSSAGSSVCFSSFLDPTVEQLGAIYLDYKSTPAPYSGSEFTAPGPGQGREEAGPFGGYANPEVSGGNGSATVSFDLPDYGIATHLSVAATPVSYTPTPADQAAAASSGVPVYALQAGGGLSGNAVYFNASFVVPASYLASHNGPLRAAAVRAASVSPEAMLTIKLVGKATGNAAVGPAVALWGALHAGAPYQELSGLLNAIENCADPTYTAEVVKYLNRVADDIAGLQAAKAATFAAGFLGAFATLGISAVAGTVASYAMSKNIQSLLANAKEAVNNALANPVCKAPRDQEEADPAWEIDPSGYTYEAVPSNRLSGVTATLLESSSPNGPFHVWDATSYGQANPLTTDSQGHYGWNVPFGYWKVAYTKAGYQTAYSKVFNVPPPRFNVDVGLTRLAPPGVTLTGATSGPSSEVEVSFDDYMKAASVSEYLTVTDSSGNPVAGKVKAIGAQATPDGTEVARSFVFLPDTAFSAGESLTLQVDPPARDYADNVLEGPYTRSLTASAPAAPGVPGELRAFPGGATSLTLAWKQPADDGGSPVTGYRVSLSPGGKTMDLGPGTTRATVDGLSPVTTYTASVAATNAMGTGTAATLEVGTPPLDPNVAFSSLRAPHLVAGGSKASATVTLGQVAPAGGTLVRLSSDDPSVASVPASVTVPAGSTSASFTVTTTEPAIPTTVTLSASRGGVTVREPMTVAVPVSLSVATSPAKPLYGQPVTLKVTTTPPRPGATLTVSEGKTPLGTGGVGLNGNATIVVKGLHAGSHTLTVSYPGDAMSLPTTAQVKVTVARAPTTLEIEPLWPNGADHRRGRPWMGARLTRSYDGAPIPGQRITLDTWKGTICSAVTDANGEVACQIPPRLVGPVASGRAKASFAGSSDYLPSSAGSDSPPGNGHHPKSGG